MNFQNKLVALFVFFGFAATAQDTLSAQQAVFIALKNNYDVLIAENNQEIAKKNNSWSEAGLFPTVQLTIGQNNLIQDNTNNPFTFTPGVILNQSFSPSISSNVNLFSGFQVKINKERLEQLETQSEGNAAVVIESLIGDVLRTYFTAVLQQKRADLLQQTLEHSRKRVRYAELQNKYSSANSLELLQLRNQYLTDSTNFLMQQLSVDNALRNLRLLMNNKEKDQSTFPVLTDELPSALQIMDKTQAKRDLMSNNLNLKNQFLAQELSQTSIELQRSFLYPTLGLNLSAAPNYGQFRQLSGGDPGQPNSISTSNIAYVANFSLRYNIYNNWKSKRAVEVAKIQAETAALNTEKLKDNLSTTLENQLALYEIRNGLVALGEENKEYAQKAYNLAERRYEVGTINSVDLIVFQNAYINTLTQYYQNLYDRLDTYLELYRLTGKLHLEYSK